MAGNGPPPGIVQIVIQGDPRTGAVQISGPPDPILTHWLLNEGRRIFEREMTKREAAATPPKIVVPQIVPPHMRS